MNHSTDQKRIVKWWKNNQQNQMDEKEVIEILMITNPNQVYFAKVLDCGFQRKKVLTQLDAVRQLKYWSGQFQRPFKVLPRPFFWAPFILLGDWK